ncbi:TatD family hydrolase [Thermaerobacillus caldiproteolyticus]|uniref:TatD family hydrolase n=1 Tax=Thermaerobacillus caldiproteolyticus TaxID=247480 RepID=UPI00188C20D1|nr:TatD family hydrolase [Anoxybacillus caldiproteolyticus]QPA32679.1 TatD family hydrolase [Anoxybacillus caldiproteolyticus]
MIDAHIHLDQYADIEETIQQWQEAGIEAVVAVSTDLRSSYRTLELKQRFPTFIYAAIGFHPEQPLPNQADWNEWTRLLQQERQHLTAIGEVGLPYYSAEAVSHFPYYRDLFEQITQLAVDTSLPLAIHAVYDRAQTALTILQKYKATKAHFHWLKANPVLVQQIIQCGYYISVTPEVCYRKRDRQLLSHVPIEQLLLETDGPWPFDGPFTDVPTSPLLLSYSLQAVASFYRQDIATIRASIVTNTRKLYK